MNLSVEKLINAQIVLPASVALPDETRAIRSILLADSDFTAIATKEDAEAVGASARSIRTHIKAVRDMGMNLRRPLQATASQIKAVEDDYCNPLEERQAKLENLVTGYAKAEALRVAEEERKRAEAVRQIEAERVAAETKARDERERIECEARDAEEKAKQAASAPTMTSGERFRAGMIEEQRKREAEESKAKLDLDVEKARADSLAAVSAIAVPIVQHKVVGAATKRVCKWEVVDEKKLLEARPELFKIELKRSAVNATCFPRTKDATAENPDCVSVPGLKLWFELETVIRSY